VLYTGNDIIEEPDAVLPHVRICVWVPLQRGCSTMTKSGV